MSIQKEPLLLQRKTLIVFGLFIVSIIVLSILWIIFSKPEKEKKTSLDIDSYHDPYSGQTVVKSSATPESYGNTTTITFLGKPKLIERGLTYEQVDLCQVILEKLNLGVANEGKRIKEATVDFSTYKQTISRKDSNKTTSFTVILNRGESRVAIKLRMLSFRHTIIELTDNEGRLLHSIDSLKTKADT